MVDHADGVDSIHLSFGQRQSPRLAMKALERGVPLQGLGGCVGRCVGEAWAEGREEVNLIALIFLLAWREASFSNVFQHFFLSSCSILQV